MTEGIESAEAPDYEVLDAPRDGLPPVIDTPEALATTMQALASGSGPLAVDTERAQSFRYTARAYLIQLRRAGAGTVLLDPIAFQPSDGVADLSALASAVADAEWIVHAASQDLPCLAEVGMLPHTLFDTELAARLLGLPRVSLSVLLEQAFGLTLRKEHSAADWSRRPLPDEWLNYAALDVEKLVELRDWLADQLAETGKEEWARQEFAHLVAQAGQPPRTRTDPWRRTSGLHTLRSPQSLAIVRELWQTRDGIASRQDRAPGKILPDRAITALAARLDLPDVRRLTSSDLAKVPEFSWRTPQRYRANWLAALERVSALTRDQLPARQTPADGPPPPRSWTSRNPAAAARWEAVRPKAVELAEQLHLPVENLIPPDALRRILWEPPTDKSHAAVDAALTAEGVRPWQRDFVVPLVLAALK